LSSYKSDQPVIRNYTAHKSDKTLFGVVDGVLYSVRYSNVDGVLCSVRNSNVDGVLCSVRNSHVISNFT